MSYVIEDPEFVAFFKRNSPSPLHPGSRSFAYFVWRAAYHKGIQAERAGKTFKHTDEEKK